MTRSAKAQDRNGAESRQESGHRVQRQRVQFHPLADHHDTGQLSRPTAEEVGLAARGLQRLDTLQARHGRANQLAAFLQQPGVDVLTPPGHVLQRQDIQSDNDESQQGQGERQN